MDETFTDNVGFIGRSACACTNTRSQEGLGPRPGRVWFISPIITREGDWGGRGRGTGEGEGGDDT